MSINSLELGYSWAHNPKIDSEFNRAQFDATADIYDELVNEWQYKSPGIAAELMHQYLGLNKTIMDCGCGTGLTGKALHEVGYRGLIGLDISTKSLEKAQEKNVYDKLQEVNLNQKLPFEDNSVDGILCVAVMTALDEKVVFSEFCRVVRPNGCIVFSQRVDLYESRNYQSAIDTLEHQKIWKLLHATEPMLYLPGHDAYGDKIKICYFVFQVL